MLMSDMQLAFVVIISGLVIVFLALIVLIALMWAMGKALSSLKREKSYARFPRTGLWRSLRLK